MIIEEKDVKKLRQELLFSRIVSIFSVITTLGLLICGILLYNKYQGLSEETQYIIESVSEIELEEFNLSLVTINKLMENVNNVLESVDWVEVSKKVTQLDVEAINETIDSLDVDALNKAIEGLDTEELSVAVKNLNATVDKVKEISETLSKVKSLIENLKFW